MKDIFNRISNAFAGHWAGEGMARFPTIKSTGYTEQLEFIPDEYKDAIFYRQKTWYKNNTHEDGHTVFWETGFIILKDERIVLHASQIGGRIEMYELVSGIDDRYTFNSSGILNDSRPVRSQRIFIAGNDHLHYQLNMATQLAPFQNHLTADLIKIKTSSL